MIKLTFWPAFSPDLDPIEAIRSLMTIYIQTQNLEFERSIQWLIEEVRAVIIEAWNSITLQ